MNTSMKNDKGDDRRARSETVEIVVGDGISVVLDYVPPLAGDWANFTSHLFGADANDPNIEYIWESSTDGGKTWTTAGLENEHDKTLRVKTNPITPSDSNADDADEDAEPVTLTYIRVRVFLGDKKATSNAQLLTVRVGDSDGTDSQNTDGDKRSQEVENALNDDKKKPNKDKDPQEQKPSQQPQQEEPEVVTPPEEQNPDEQTPEEVQPEQPQEQEQPEPTQRKVTPVDVTYDDTSSNADDTEMVSPEKSDKDEQSAEAGASLDPSNLIVDKNVTDKIKKQNAKTPVDKEATPGARWTELSTMNNDDVRRVLAGNPFAPFAAPFAFGVTAAGAIEKLVVFRRQIK